MESKTVILSVLIMSLVMAQTHVDAEIYNDCCPSLLARNKYNICRGSFGSMKSCAEFSGCKLVTGPCPSGYTNDILETTGDAVTKYCKVGCASSVCGALVTLQGSDANEIVNGAVEKCAKACSTICTKGSVSEVIKTA